MTTFVSRMSKSFVRRGAIAATLLTACVLSAARAAEPEVLTKVPGDAYGLVVVNSTRTFAGKISNVATRLNIPAPPDLVGYATRSLGITEGFDANGSVALVLLKPAADKQAEPYFAGMPPAILLLPTSDAKLLLKPFDPGTPDAKGVMEVKLPSDPDEKGYALVVEDKWVALAQNKDDLTAYAGRTDSFAAKASEEVKKVFDVNDVVIWGNLPKLGMGVDKALDDAQSEFSGMLELAAVAGSQDAFSSALQKQFVGMGFGFVKQLMKDADSSMLTVRLSDSGASFGVVGDFKADSKIGKFVAAQKTEKPLSFSGLPAAGGMGAAAGSGFLLLGAGTWESKSIQGVMDEVFANLLKDETIAKDPRAAQLKAQMKVNKEILALTTGASFILLDPPAGGKGGLLQGAAILETESPDKLREVELQAFKNPLVFDPMNPDIKVEVTEKADAITVGETKLNKVKAKYSLRAETPDKPVADANRLAFSVLQKMYGADGLTVYFGTAGKKALIIYGSETATVEAAVKAAVEEQDNISSNPVVGGLHDQVVANPIGVMYLPVTRWFTLAQSILMPGGEGAAPDAAVAGAPPVVVSAGVTGNMVTAEMHIPVATVMGVQKAIEKMKGAPGGGGQLP